MVRPYQSMQGGALHTLADVTNGADDTYYYYLDMDMYRRLGAQLVIDGGSGTCTVTVEGSMEDQANHGDVGTWVDVTNTLFGSASFTASGILLSTDFSAGLFKWLRFKVVASTGGADDADWAIYAKQVY